MAIVHKDRWRLVDARAATAFLVAGVTLAGVAAYKTVFAFTPVEVSTVVDTGYGGLALVLTGLALLALYPRVRDGSPKTATAAALASCLSIGFVLVIWGWLIGTTVHLGRVPVIPEEAPIWAAAMMLGNFVTLSTAFLLIAVGSRRTDAIPDSASILSVVPALMWLGLIANVGLGLVPNMSILVYVVNALAVGGIGYVIRARGTEATTGSPTADSSTGRGEVP